MPTVTNQIILEIRERILTGQYPPGSHLQEAKTASELAVSRTPIREAFRVLANEELLIYSPNRGYIVRSISLKEVLDAYDIKGAVEGLAARLIAERGLSEAMRARFEVVVARGDAALARPGWGDEHHREMLEMRLDFHHLLLEASENAHIEALLRPFRLIPRLYDPRLEPDSEFFQRAYSREVWAHSQRDLLQLVIAMARREGSRADALARELAYMDREIFRQAVEDQLAGEAPGAAATAVEDAA